MPDSLKKPAPAHGPEDDVSVQTVMETGAQQQGDNQKHADRSAGSVADVQKQGPGPDTRPADARMPDWWIPWKICKRRWSAAGEPRIGAETGSGTGWEPAQSNGARIR